MSERNERKPVRESATPYVVEPQVEVHIPLSALFKAVECLGEDELRQLRQWADERLAALPAEASILEGKPDGRCSALLDGSPQMT